MKRKACVALMLCIVFVIIIAPGLVLARELGFVISEKGEFIRIDVANNSILQQGKLGGIRYIENSPGNVAYDKVNSLLIIVDSSHNIQTVFAYDLKTLSLRKTLDIKSETIEEENAVRVLMSPAKQVFYVKWWDKSLNNGSGGPVISSFETPTLTKLSSYTSISLTDKLMISNDGARIYSCSDEESSARIDVIDSIDFRLLRSINLEPFITPGAYGRAIEDFKNERILIVENRKQQTEDLDTYSLYTIDPNSLLASRRIDSGLEGDCFLFPSGRKVALSETKNISLTSLGRIKSLGKIHIYDLSAAQEIGTITVGESDIGSILGVSADERRLYYLQSGRVAQVSQIVVVDLTNYSIVGKIRAPANSIIMFTYQD